MTARTLIAACLLLGAAGCNVNVESDGDENAAGLDSSANATAQAQPRSGDETAPDPESVARAQALARSQGADAQRAQWRQQARTELGDLRILVDQSDRKVRVYRGDTLMTEHDVAVGTEENPTPIGDFAFNRVDLNPRWVPPDSEWAEDREPQPPGDPDNPMGRARLVYRMPYTIHGTDNLDSLGKAVSHGSIRLANEHVVPLAEILLKAGGSWEGENWFREMVRNRTEEYQIPLEQEIPLKIQE